MLVNGVNGGWLNTRLYYIRTMKRKQEQAEALDSQLDRSVNENLTNSEDDVNFLKGLVVCPGNMDVFKEKLNSSRKFRAEMMKKPETEIKEYFPYFFTHPIEMVILFFFADEIYSNKTHSFLPLF